MINNRSKKPVICVIGMGYVGFPLAVVAAKKGYSVIGFDTDKTKLARIARGENIVEEKFLDKLLPQKFSKLTDSAKDISLAEIFVIAVPTPVDEMHYPDLGYVVRAAESVAKNMKSGSLVLVESTINPGVCEEVVKPIFEKAGWKIGKSVFIVHCPERINPGDPKWNVSNIPRVIGSFDESGLKRGIQFYESIISGKITPMRSIREAEAVKIMENSFRDVNIAFVNELARSFELMGIDAVNVIRGASTKPFAFMAHWPSCGVGGHCIPVDPYYLIEKAKENDFEHVFLEAARAINNDMPRYTVRLLQDKLNELEKSVKGARIGLLGLSYKANVADLRESPALKILDILKKKGSKPFVFDPFIPEMSNVKKLEELLSKSEAILVAVNHKIFTRISPDEFMRNGIKVIIDGKNCLDKDAIAKKGILYQGIGR